jgi:hypothetical protein
MKFSRSDFEMQRFESSRPSHAVGLRAGKNTLTRTRRPSGLRAKSPKSSPRDKAADRNSGINAKVLPDVWSKAVAAMISAIKDGRPGDGFVAAVELRGEQLALHFPPGALNPDELPNKVVEI